MTCGVDSTWEVPTPVHAGGDVVAGLASALLLPARTRRGETPRSVSLEGHREQRSCGRHHLQFLAITATLSPLDAANFTPR